MATITILSSRYQQGYPGKPANISIDTSEISAVSYFKGQYAAGKSVHLKDGTAHGTIEPLAEILARVANASDTTTAKNIKVIVHDKTPGQYGYPQTKVRTSGDRFSLLEI